MKFTSKYYGDIEYEEKEIMTFNNGILGFSDFKKYIIVPLKDNENFYMLQSLEDEDVGVILINTFEFFKDYEISLKDDVIKALDINEEKEVMVYSVVTLNSELENITVNLRAPIIININTFLGEQIILDKENYLIRQPLFKS